jgi:hypothetical protein
VYATVSFATLVHVAAETQVAVVSSPSITILTFLIGEYLLTSYHAAAGFIAVAENAVLVKEILNGFKTIACPPIEILPFQNTTSSVSAEASTFPNLVLVNVIFPPLIR